MLHLKKNRRIVIVFLYFFAFAFVASGQNLYFKATKIIDRDADIIVNDIIQDENGLLWMATNEGLLSSDGESLFRNYKDESLENIVISCLFISNDTIHMGWENGNYSRFSINNNRIIYSKKISSSPITAISKGQGDDVWIASEENGISRLNTNELKTYDVNFGLADNFVNDLYFDHEQNAIWVATDRGISISVEKNNKITFENLNESNGLSDNLITGIEKDDLGYFWVASYSGKLFSVDQSHSVKAIDMGLKWKPNKISALNYYEGKIWVAYENNGLALIDSKMQQLLSFEVSASANGIRDIQFVSKNMLMALKGKNEIYITNNNFRFYTKEFDPSIKNISVVYSHTKDELYYANEDGIYLKNANDSISLVLDLKKKDIAYVISLLIDYKGELWFGTFDKGLYNLSNGLLKQISEEEGLINNNVMALKEWNHSVWCATLGGLSSVKKNNNAYEISNFSKNEGLNAAYIYQLYASEREIYIASDGSGLISFNNTGFNVLSENKKETIFDITGMGSDTIYVSGKEGEISEYKDGKKANVFEIKFKNRPVELTGLRQVSKNKLLFIWEHGVGVLDLNTGKYRLFDSDSGINDFENNYLNAISLDNENNAFVGTQNYLLKIDPLIKDEKIGPKSIFRSIELFSSKIDSSIHEFANDQNHFSFKLSSLWFQNPKNVKYQYRLIGLSEDWVNTKDNEVVFPKLNAGNYRFEFRSGFTGSIENAQSVSYSFEIRKAFYATWWFFIILLVLLYLGIYGLVKYRDNKAVQRKKMEYEKVLSEFELLKSQVNPHFLFNSLNTAYALISKDEDEAKEYVLSLSKYLRAILTKNQDHIISLEKELKFAKNYTVLQKKRFGDSLLFNINIDDAVVLESYIPPLTLQILVENAIKHNIISKSMPLITSVYAKDGFIIVENNLQIKNKNSEGTKIGLSNIKSRYKILFDEKIQIIQNEDSFIVKLPIIKKYVKDIVD
jgi:ligand-binding sensor domain-containing protein